jgi:pimeloyl-ACP methyl ester carboxylesterase
MGQGRVVHDRKFTIAVALGVAVVMCALAGCTVGPSQRPPVAVRGDSMPAGGPPPAPVPLPSESLPDPEAPNLSIGFFDCTSETLADLPIPLPAGRQLTVGCSQITAPSDSGVPGDPDTSLSVTRSALPGAPADQPVIVVVGDSATEPSALAAVELAAQAPPELLEQYSLVGIDRRGSGSDPLDCSPADARAALVDADPAAVDEASLGRLLEKARAVVQGCNLALGGGLSDYRTSATSSDLEELRAQLGTRRLSVIGVGDGAAAVVGWVGAAPQAVGRVVLDGPPQPGVDEPQLTDSRAKATEATFDAFATACRARAGCPLGADPRAAVTGLVATLRARPLPSDDGRVLSAGAALLATREGLGEPRQWPALASALAGAGAGQAGPLLDFLDPLVGARGRFDATLATACNDSARRLAPAEIAATATTMGRTYPLFGTDMAQGLVACAPWPASGAAAAAAPGGAIPPVLVIGTAADPRSTLDAARHAAAAIPSARFVSWQGAGIGAYPRTECVTNVVDGVFLNGIMPEDNTLCPP